MINEYNFNTKFLECLAELGVAQMGIFSKSSGIWCIFFSIMFYEFVFSNNSSFEPQHYLEDAYIPIFALIYIPKL